MNQTTTAATKLTPQQIRIVKLLFKFRFVTAPLLSKVLRIHSVSTYEVLERLVALGLVSKVYEKSYRIDRKAAYYFLNSQGVTVVRRLMDVPETVVHPLYKNDAASSTFAQHCLDVLACYPSIKQHAPEGSDLFTKAEINRFKQFPKNRPELYLRTPQGQEAMILLIHDSEPYVIRKRLDEVIRHSEEEGWPTGTYPTIAFVVRDVNATFRFLYKAARKLDGMGIDQDDLTILATPITSFGSEQDGVWSSVYSPRKFVALLPNM